MAARLTALSMIASLQAEIVDLDRIQAWLRVFGMVNCASDFNRMPQVLDGFTDVVVAIFGAERGRHARSAVGVLSLPFDIPVEVEAELLIAV